MKSGFSLFELLIALSIMALLGSFVIPNIQRIQTKSHRMASEVNLRIFQSSVENYFLDHMVYPKGDLPATELFTLLNSESILKTSPANPYTKKPYAADDTRGKITYASADGLDYDLTLYDADGTTVQLAVTSL